MHVVATAGHVDHGKSTLIRALTGMEPDRWAEEKRRGMTIDLGYAWTTLGDGTQLAFVDVPGHRRFIGNTLAGVGPVPAVLLVVASDAGWSQQTGEHARALDALGVRHGVLALTRADLGDAELAEQEARTHLAGTSLADIEAVAVSPVSGLGLDDLRSALGRLTASLPPPPAWPARLWVDRSFSVRGAGTVVTGTLPTGSVEAGQQLQVVPSGRTVRVRSVQTLHETVERADAVSRVALNLRGVDPSDVPRGSALVAIDEWVLTSTVDVLLDVAVDSVPEHSSLHLGSAALPVRVRPLGERTARLTLDRVVPVRRGDRALLRDPGAVQAMAGATVVDPLPAPLRQRGAARRRAVDLDAMSRGGGEVELRVRGYGLTADLLRAGVLSDLPPSAVRAGAWLVDPVVWRSWVAALDAAVERRAAEQPMRPGLPRGSASEAVGLPDVALVDHLVAASAGLVLDADGVHRAGASATLAPAADRAVLDLLAVLDEHPFGSPDAPWLEAAGLTDDVLRVAVRRGDLVAVGAGIYLQPAALDEALTRLTALPQPFTASAARAALDTTRRVALPLLEHLDRRRLTERVDATLRRVVAS